MSAHITHYGPAYRSARLFEEEIEKTLLRLRELARQQMALAGKDKKERKSR